MVYSPGVYVTDNPTHKLHFDSATGIARFGGFRVKSFVKGTHYVGSGDMRLRVVGLQGFRRFEVHGLWLVDAKVEPV